MKILILGQFLNRGWDGSISDENHIADALEELGHSVERLQRDRVGAFNEQYDFVLISQWDGYAPNLISTLKTNTLGAPIIYWAFDYQADGQEWHERLANQVDLYLSKRIADSKYPNWRWLSQDFAPKFLDKTPKTPVKDIDVLFTGSYLPWATERNDTLKTVSDNFPLVIHSVNSWPEEWKLDVRPPIMDEGLPELYARAKVILSIDHTIEAGYWSDRNAQIIACDGRPLFRYVPLSEARFNTRVDYFYDTNDCLNKIQHRLENPWDYPQNMDNLYVTHRVLDLLTIAGSL